MELWTEYEGRTIDGAFPLKKLLLPEGRSAFFSTSNGNGDPTVIRLIASHFDEDEILARWRGVDALHHHNILKLEKYGQLILDDTTVVYAVMEPVDANLAEVIANQRLSLDDARDLAASLASAIAVLHANGFVHEHIEPANIFAVGEVVKLRGDCIRETPEGAAALEAQRHDVHDIGVVLLQALTQEQTLPAVGSRIALPAPFDRIVPNAMNGTWSLAEIQAALGVPRPATIRPAAPIPVVSVPQPSPTRQAANPPAAIKNAPEPAPESDPPLSRNGNFTPPTARPRPQPAEGLPRTSPRTLGIGAAVVVAILLTWLALHFSHSSTATQVLSAKPALTPVAASVSPARKTTTPASNQVSTPTGAQWRVIAFTYNRQDQAQKKASTIAHNHPDLHPEVFTPSGRAPYLVAIGGPMSRDQAYAIVHRSSHWNLPEDTYAQNYTVKSR
jgi:hypothetical protein